MARDRCTSDGVADLTLTARSRVRRALGRRRRRLAWDAIAHPRLAWLSPLPPATTGIASYSAAVLDELRRVGFMDRRRLDPIWPIEPKHEGLVPWYRLSVYHVANNVEFHRDIYRFACQAPGLVVLHDLALDDFVRGMKAAGDPLGFAAEREAAQMREGLSSARDFSIGPPLRDASCAHVLRRARGVIVHSPFAKGYLETLGTRTPLFVVPHPAVEGEEDMRAALGRRAEMRSRARADAADLLVVAPGDLNAAKQLEVLLASVARLDEHVRVALVGRRIEGYDVDGLVARSGLGDRVTLSTDVTDDDFRAWLVAGDAIVDLRHPHRGEVSGSLARAMQAGRPSIVSAIGSYLDVPGELVLRVPPGPCDPEELAATIRTLDEYPEMRARMGNAAKAHVERLRTTHATARGYEEAMEATLSVVTDPARTAYARWARALTDIGIDESTLGLGYGLEYARAMETFRLSRDS